MLIQIKDHEGKEVTLNPHLITSIEKQERYIDEYYFDDDADETYKEYCIYIYVSSSNNHYYKQSFNNEKDRDAEYEELIIKWKLALK